jgi:hypothetical protein
MKGYNTLSVVPCVNKENLNNALFHQTSYIQPFATIEYLFLSFKMIHTQVWVLRKFSREPQQKGKAQYSWPPCKVRSVANIIYLFTKQVNLKGGQE